MCGMEKTLKGRLLELAARLHQLPPDERRELAPAVKRAHDALPPRGGRCRPTLAAR